MQDESKAALAKALKMLQTSERFESEVRAKLASFSPDSVDEVIEYLKAKRLLNDARAAEQFALLKSGRKAVGSRRLRQELEQRGADAAIVDSVLPNNEQERIAELLRLKYKPTDDPMKAGRFLFSRGFSENDIETALSNYFGELA